MRKKATTTKLSYSCPGSLGSSGGIAVRSTASSLGCLTRIAGICNSLKHKKSHSSVKSFVHEEAFIRQTSLRPLREKIVL